MSSLSLLFVSIGSTILFLVYSIFKFGLTKSISVIYYYFKGFKRYLYTYYMIGYALPLMLAANNFWLYVAGSLIMVTGVAADTRADETTSWVHTRSVIVAIVIGFAYTMFGYGLFWVSLIGAISCLALYYFKPKYHTYIIEIIAIAVVYIGVFSVA